jgi:phosphatidylserine decarboxylase
MTETPAQGRRRWRPHRHPLLLRHYGLLPHRAMNAAVALWTNAALPRPLVRLAIAAWVRRGKIDLSEVEVEDWPTLEAFFLRRLRPGARPIGAGIVAPADGFVVSCGRVGAPGDDAGALMLDVKGRPLSLRALLCGDGTASDGRADAATGIGDADLRALAGGWQLTTFLTPDGYHHVHCPVDGELVDVAWLPGRFFPQNDDALAVIDDVYARNERAVLRLRDAAGRDVFVVLVAASLVGGIELEGMPRALWQRSTSTPIGRAVRRGERLGCFRFGSTVVVVVPPGVATMPALRAGDSVRVGATIAALANAP